MTNKTDLNQGLRVGILDIEASSLSADFGYMFCVCVKEVNEKDLNGKIHTIRIDDKRNKDPFSDKFVVKELTKLLDTKFDLIVTWFGSRYDFPFINTRAMKHGVRPPVRNFRRDLCFVARGVGKLRNNQLVTWDEFLNGKALKTRMNPDIWNAAIRNEKKAHDWIVDHCQRDVLSTEKVYKKFVKSGLLGKLRRG